MILFLFNHIKILTKITKKWVRVLKQHKFKLNKKLKYNNRKKFNFSNRNK